MLSPKPAPRRTRRGDEGRPSVASRESRAGAHDERERKTWTDGSLNLGVSIAHGRRCGGATLSTAPVASPAADSIDLPLVVGVSTRALFELEEENAVFERLGEAAYTDLQRERELKMLEPGCAFELIRRLLALNPAEGPRLVEVVLLSRNAPDLALRAFRSCERHGLAITEGSFTSGRSLAPFLAAWGVDLFLSNCEDDVCAAVEAGRAAAILGPVPPALRREGSDEVSFGLDGDAVTFGAESETIFRRQGLEAFERHERRSARVPLTRGPFGGALLLKLAELRRQCQRSDGTSHVRIVMVTARAAPAHERVIRTLRSWHTLFDEVHFVGPRAKAPFLAAAGVQIYFDDREAHVEVASRLVAAGRVPELPSPQRHGDVKAR